MLGKRRGTALDECAPMDTLLRIFEAMRPWAQELRHINPWGAAVTAALLAAWFEQRRAARRAPPFTAEHQGAIGGKPRY